MFLSWAKEIMSNKPMRSFLFHRKKMNKSGTEKIKCIDEEMTKIMDSVSAIQQKRAHAEREQSKKKPRLALGQLIIDKDESK